MSFTRNLGGFETVHTAVRQGYAPGVSVAEFRARSGLSESLSHLVAQFFLATDLVGRTEIVIEETLVRLSLAQEYDHRLLPRLYLFALHLNRPGNRILADHRAPAQLQNHLIRNVLYGGDGWRAPMLNKDGVLEPEVARVGAFTSNEARRKWVNNYYHLFGQCNFVVRPDGLLEVFPDTWGMFALYLFCERVLITEPGATGRRLVDIARTDQLHRLIGVPAEWVEERLPAVAELVVNSSSLDLPLASEEEEDRTAAQATGQLPPPASGTATRRAVEIERLQRQATNKTWLNRVYGGACQVSGVVLRLPNGDVTFDAAHIQPLGTPHNGPDDVSNMLSLSPTMHRLLDRGCLAIDPDNLSITLLHGNDVPHLPNLRVEASHEIDRERLRYLRRLLLRA